MNLFNKKILATTVATALTAGSMSGVVQAEEKSFMEALKDGKASLSFRLRVEDVEVSPATGGSVDATATTLKTRLNYATGAYNGLSGFIEFDQVSEMFEVEYNTGPGGTAYPGKATVADPEGTDLNQAFVQYKVDGNTTKYGRQRIVLDDQRFVGGVAWRQNEQTYDSVSYTGVFGSLKLFGAYVYNVNRVFGDDRASGDHDQATGILNVNYKVSDAASITGYYYAIDNEVAAFSHYSSDTLGLRFTGKSGIFGYSAEYASQTDGGDNAKDYSASFLAVEGSVTAKPVTFTLGYQNLGADGSDGFFVTPLATLHKFQGWADVFLGGGTGNVAGGIQDTYLKVGGKFGGVKAAVVYHQFGSDDAAAAGGIDDYGTEVGLVVGGKVGPVGLTAKYADYSADDFASDTQKVWLMATLAL